MKQLIALATLGLALGLAACSSDGSSGGGWGGGSGGNNDTSSSSSSSCEKQYLCQNGACKCTNEGPNKGSSCCDPDESSCASSSSNCNTFCKVCK